MPINPELLRTRAREIREGVSTLRLAGALPLLDFLRNLDLRDATLYRLLVAIEAAQSICNHLAAQVASRAPDSLPDCFQALQESGVIEAPLAGRLGRMARFRNLLVHRYWEVDYARVHRMLSEDLGDLELYLEQVGRHSGAAL